MPCIIGASIAAEIRPKVIPGIAGILSAIAIITISGGKSKTGLILKLFKIPSIRTSACDVSTLPVVACTKPYIPKNTSAIAYATIVDFSIYFT